MKFLDFMLRNVRCCLLFPVITYADSVSQQASGLFSVASSDIVSGSADILSSGVELSVASVSYSGEFIILTIKGAAEAAEIVLRLPRHVLGGASVAAGQSVELVASTAGNILTVAGKVIAFIPNELGKGLLRSAPIK